MEGLNWNKIEEELQQKLLIHSQDLSCSIQILIQKQFEEVKKQLESEKSKLQEEFEPQTKIVEVKKEGWC